MLMVAGYVCFCMRGFYLKPTLQFDPSVPTSLHPSIENWYSHEEGVPQTSMSMENLLFAITHPHSPAKLKCHVFYDIKDKSVSIIDDAGAGYFPRLVMVDGEWTINMIRDE